MSISGADNVVACTVLSSPPLTAGWARMSYMWMWIGLWISSALVCVGAQPQLAGSERFLMGGAGGIAILAELR